MLVPKLTTNSNSRHFFSVRFHFTNFFIDFQKTNENLFSWWLLVKMNIMRHLLNRIEIQNILFFVPLKKCDFENTFYYV